MARDGSGNASRVVTPPANGDIANATDYNAELNDVYSMMSDSINKAGTKAFAANQPMGGFIFTGLGAGSSNGHSVRYEQMNSAISAYAQPLDATLTALAALSWASGNALVQFTAADTVSLTLTPSVSSYTASQGAANTTPTATLTNTTDNASVRVLRLDGDRATPAANDELYVSYYLSDSAGTQTEAARIMVRANVVTAGSMSSKIFFYTASAGTLAARMVMTGSVLEPLSNDGMALGEATIAWSDLYGASGFTLNCNNGNAILTHVTGGYEVTTGALAGPTLLSSETGGTLTSASRNRRVVCSSGPTLPASGMTVGDWILIDPNGTARTVTRPAAHAMYVRDTDSATATSYARNCALAVFQASGVWLLHGIP